MRYVISITNVRVAECNRKTKLLEKRRGPAMRSVPRNPNTHTSVETRDATNTTRSPWHRTAAIFALSALLVTTTGCGLFGSGKKKGNKYGEEPTLSETDLEAQREARFGTGTIPTPEGEGLFRDVHFAYDSSAISEQAQQDIESNAQLLRTNDTVRVQLEGHADERGTEEYNMTLGQARAKAVRDLLVSVGVPPTRIDVISYGENVPLDAGHDEAAYARNRRVHFSPIGQGQ
jgi:peptidoglycan-associated lipoprotein